MMEEADMNHQRCVTLVEVSICEQPSSGRSASWHSWAGPCSLSPSNTSESATLLLVLAPETGALGGGGAHQRVESLHESDEVVRLRRDY